MATGGGGGSGRGGGGGGGSAGTAARRRVVELGAGTALCGLMIALMVTDLSSPTCLNCRT